MLGDVVGIDWVIIEQYAPIPRGHPQAASCRDYVDEPQQLVLPPQGILFAGALGSALILVSRPHFYLHRWRFFALWTGRSLTFVLLVVVQGNTGKYGCQDKVDDQYSIGPVC